MGGFLVYNQSTHMFPLFKCHYFFHFHHNFSGIFLIPCADNCLCPAALVGASNFSMGGAQFSQTRDVYNGDHVLQGYHLHVGTLVVTRPEQHRPVSMTFLLLVISIPALNYSLL